MTAGETSEGALFAARFNPLAAQQAQAAHAERQKHLPPAERANDASSPMAVARRLAARDERERIRAARRIDER
ncbi:MAG: hypothetical protein EAS51_12815 [Microbacteriaceae bacterium]|nr:MAG: hypothetical protein EAS51_12815 [Microbacteriaceae bacterium]